MKTIHDKAVVDILVNMGGLYDPRFMSLGRCSETNIKGRRTDVRET
jgi:hypothetical protein